MSETLADVPTNVCTSPDSASAPMCAFIPKYHWLPFLSGASPGRGRLPCSSSSWRCEDGRSHQRAGAQEQLALAQQRVDLGQDGRRQCVLFKQVPEVSSGSPADRPPLFPSASYVDFAAVEQP